MEDSSTKYHLPFARNTSKFSSSPLRKRKLGRPLHGRKIFSLDGGKTLRLEGCGQVPDSNANFSNKQNSKTSSTSMRGHPNRFKQLVESTRKRSIQSLISSRRDIETQGRGPIVMVSHDVEVGSQCSESVSQGESVVVQVMDCIDGCLEEGITLDMLDSCILAVHAEEDIDPDGEHSIAEHIITEQEDVSQAVNGNIQDFQDANKSSISSVLTVTSKQRKPARELHQDANVFTEPVCELIIKKEQFSSEEGEEEELENDENMQNVLSGNGTFYPALSIKDEPFCETDPLLNDDADPNQLIQLYVNNSETLVEGLNDPDGVSIGHHVEPEHINSHFEGIMSSRLSAALPTTAIVTPSKWSSLSHFSSYSKVDTAFSTTVAADGTTSTSLVGSGKALSPVPFPSKPVCKILDTQQHDHILSTSKTSTLKQDSSRKKYDKYSERKEARASAAKKSTKNSLGYVKVDKEDPRSRLHFVKYMKKEGKTIKIWECGICGREFIHQYTLMRHLPTHTDERNYRCVECGKAFRQMSTLSQHRATHSKSRPYVCDVCKKTFNRVSTLISHKKIHEGVKPHVCNQCGKGFHQKGNLKNHMFIHTNERPYKCYCGRGFNQASNLHSHRIRAHSDNNPVLSTSDHLNRFSPSSSSSFMSSTSTAQTQQQRLCCPLCPLSFSYRATLKKHEIAVHGRARDIQPRQLAREGASDDGDEAEGLRYHKRRKVGSMRVQEMPDGTETFHELTQESQGSSVFCWQVPSTRLQHLFAKDESELPPASLLIPPIRTAELSSVLASGTATPPFALFKPATAMSVVVKVAVLSPQCHLLLPATAAELKAASQLSAAVPSRGGSGHASQVKIPVVATIVQKFSSNGESLYEILSPDEAQPCLRKLPYSRTASKLPFRKVLNKLHGQLIHSNIRAATNAPSEVNLTGILNFQVSNNNTSHLTFTDTPCSSVSGQVDPYLQREDSRPALATLSTLADTHQRIPRHHTSGHNSLVRTVNMSTDASASTHNSSLLSNVRASINTVYKSNVPSSSASISPLMTLAATESCVSSSAGLSPAYLTVAGGDVGNAAGDLPSCVLAAHMNEQVLPIESDIIETVADTVIEDDSSVAPQGDSDMSSLLGADHDAYVTSDGGTVAVEYGSVEQPLLDTDVHQLVADEQHQQLQDAELAGLRYLRATGTPGEYEMVAPDDPRLTHVVQFGQLQEVTHQNGEDVDSGGLISTPNLPTTVTTTQTTTTVDTNSVTDTAVATDADDAAAILVGPNSADDPSNSTDAGSITLTESGGLTIETANGTVTVGEGGTVAVDNLEALIGMLQRAGVPVQLQQGPNLQQLHLTLTGGSQQQQINLGVPGQQQPLTTGPSSSEHLQGLCEDVSHQILIADEECIISDQELQVSNPDNMN